MKTYEVFHGTIHTDRVRLRDSRKNHRNRDNRLVENMKGPAGAFWITEQLYFENIQFSNPPSLTPTYFRTLSPLVDIFRQF